LLSAQFFRTKIILDLLFFLRHALPDLVDPLSLFIMGIKFFFNYLRDHPELVRKASFGDQNRVAQNQAKTIVWDVLGFLPRLCCVWSREFKLFGDLLPLFEQCSQVVRAFKSRGFELVIFIDGYFWEEKLKEKRKRKKQSLKDIDKYIKCVHALEEQPSQSLKKLPFVVSGCVKDSLQKLFRENGCKGI